jgi:murein DD-endopeptidase MepM/ murein hydrolase activator NlpD
MRPLSSSRRLALAAAVAAPCIVGGGAALPALPRPAPSTAAAPTPRMIAAGCPPWTLPDGDGACVHLPSSDEGAPAVESAVNTHRDRRGDWVVYDQIPRRPDRPVDYDAYRFPVPCDHGCVISGYDLDRPDAFQRRGARLRYVGHGAVDLAAARGTPAVAISLEHQQGPAQLVYAGWLFGNTVVTRHVVLEGGEHRVYLVLLGHLDAIAPSLVVGRDVVDGDVLGVVGDSGSKGLVHLHLEVRRWRDSSGPEPLTAAAGQPSALIAEAKSMVCDPRNVLPLR